MRHLTKNQLQPIIPFIENFLLHTQSGVPFNFSNLEHELLNLELDKIGREFFEAAISLEYYRVERTKTQLKKPKKFFFQQLKNNTQHFFCNLSKLTGDELKIAERNYFQSKNRFDFPFIAELTCSYSYDIVIHALSYLSSIFDLNYKDYIGNPSFFENVFLSDDEKNQIYEDRSDSDIHQFYSYLLKEETLYKEIRKNKKKYIIDFNFVKAIKYVISSNFYDYSQNISYVKHIILNILTDEEIEDIFTSPFYNETTLKKYKYFFTFIAERNPNYLRAFISHPKFETIIHKYPDLEIDIYSQLGMINMDLINIKESIEILNPFLHKKFLEDIPKPKEIKKSKVII